MRFEPAHYLVLSLLSLGACAEAPGDGAPVATDTSLDERSPPDVAPADTEGEVDDLALDVEGPSPTLAWSDEEAVTTGEVTLAFNNTSVAARDAQHRLHLTWAEAGQVRYGSRAAHERSWTVHAVPRTGSAPAAKPTLVIAGDMVIVAWSEGDGRDRRVVANATRDGGASWLGDLPISANLTPSSAVSVVSYDVAGNAGASFAWVDEAARRIRARSWRGPSWSSGALGEVRSVEAGSTPAGDPQIFGAPGSLWVVWDLEPSAGGTRTIHLARSKDGETFEPARALGVTQPGDEPDAGNDASGCVLGTTVVVGYQSRGRVLLARSVDGGATFSPAGALGPGLFAHLACAEPGLVATAWEHFEGGDMRDDSLKTVGLSLSLDALATAQGPHAMPGSDARFQRIQAAVSVRPDVIDVFWVEGPGERATLGHREAWLR